MNLEKYKDRRKFNQTPEPLAFSLPPDHKQLIFVIQKHQASRLHYDLRIELDGVLRSWAIPKGPSLDPSQKRLAVMVEEHPFEYKNFEGTIPKGNYGAGTVMIWDEGTYSIPACNNIEQIENSCREGLNKGHLHIEFSGVKIQGAFQLLRFKKGAQQNNWLLIKENDRFVSKIDILKMDRSIRTGRTLEEISDGENEEKKVNDFKQINLTNATKEPFHQKLIRPMMAVLTKEPFDDPEWIFEIKWDGFRAIAETRKDNIRFYSRRGNSFITDYPTIANELHQFSFEAIFDGEIVAVDSLGRSDFGTLQRYKRTNNGVLIYYVFDLLYFDGHNLQSLPLYERKSILKKIMPQTNYIHYCDHVEQNGRAFFTAAKENHLEGIIAKNKYSIYQPGIRSKTWQKIKISLNQEIVIGGFTERKGWHRGIGSLLMGIYNDEGFIYIGNVGSGFTDEEIPEIRTTLEQIILTKPAFLNPPAYDSTTTWVKPELVAEVHFAEWTSEGFMRQPVFKGFRTDITPENVKREIATDSRPNNLTLTHTNKNSTKIIIDNITLPLSNIEKIYWPKLHITKGDMIDYYRSISPYILPHLNDRPQSLHRFPDGIEGKHFFQKDLDHTPDWISLLPLSSDTEGKIVKYLVCQNEAALLYMANLGTIEINPWISRQGSLDYPDYMVIDLDPLECPFSQVIEVARIVHAVFLQIETPHYLKTSGATGMHISVPLGALYSYEQSRLFANLICVLVHQYLPEITSIERSPVNRKGKVYLDFLQNVKGKTLAAPYSLRPLPDAPVSTPLRWEELSDTLNPQMFNINTIKNRLELEGDLWKPILGTGINMQTSLNRLSALLD